MRKILFAAAAAASLAAAVPAYAGGDSTENRGGIDIGPMGQCFDARACGHARGAYASTHACSMVRERVVTENGRVIFKRHRVCN